MRACNGHVIQDDVIDEVDNLIAAAKCLKERGTYKVYVVATHGIFTKAATEQLELSPIDEVKRNGAVQQILCCQY